MNFALSENNLISRIRGTDVHYIVNPLSKNADLLTEREARAIAEGTFEPRDMLIERGYLVDPMEERSRYRRAYLDFLKARDDDEVQLFFVPTYSCNFACDYCYQHPYEDQGGRATVEVVSAFFDYIDRVFSGRRKYLTLFGGEPLLPSDSSRATLETFVAHAARRDIEVSVVTNGYHLGSYLDLLVKARIREIQVTLDGPKEIHDRRRPLRSGGSTFDTIVAGIDAAIARDLAVNLRVVVDRDNLATLPELARFAIDRGWTHHPGFKTQLGRNYELHECQTDRNKLFTRLELYEELYPLLMEHKELLEFHKPALSIARFLSENHSLPEPLFDACPGTKTEWAFDGEGGIYSCTATVGKRDEALGRFYPDVTTDAERIANWEDRDVMAIDQCAACSVRLLCGGGCGSVAKNNHGTLLSPDCRPVKDLLDIGMGLYFQQRSEDES